MTPIEKRIAIALTQGIHICPSCNHQIDPTTCHCGGPAAGGHCDNHAPVPMGCTCGYWNAEMLKLPEPDCPNYLEDRDEMHKAVEALTDDERFLMAIHLKQCTNKDQDWACCEEERWSLACWATAEQLADALLMTFGILK